MPRVHTFNITDMDLMIEAGLFDAVQVELRDGVIVDMSPPSPIHEELVDMLVKRFMSAFFQHGLFDAVRVRSQNTVNLGLPDWLPIPDVVILREADYSSHRPEPQDVLLLIEVSKTTLATDLGRKLEVYAQAGIVEYWVADISASLWHIYHTPRAGQYLHKQQLPFGTALTPQSFPDLRDVWL